LGLRGSGRFFDRRVRSLGLFALALQALFDEVLPKLAPVRSNPLFAYSPPWCTVVKKNKVGRMMSEDYDWSAEIAKVPMPVLLVFADNDSVSQKHVTEFFALLGGGVKEPCWVNTQLSKSCLAVVPGYSHYDFILPARDRGSSGASRRPRVLRISPLQAVTRRVYPVGSRLTLRHARLGPRMMQKQPARLGRG
jgi:hypothetical protein